MINDVYSFAIGGTKRVLYRLKNIDCCYLVFSNNFEKYIDMLLHDQPKFIVGLGTSNTNQDSIEIEKAEDIKNNQISLMIQELIDRKELDSQYIFLKVPQNVKPWISAPTINQMILEFVTEISINK